MKTVKILETEDGYFLVGFGKETSNKFVYSLDEDVFNKVKQFVDLFPDTIKYWLNRHDKPGTTYYWEENYHDKIAGFLQMMMPDVPYREISNCLGALGM